MAISFQCMTKFTTNKKKIKKKKNLKKKVKCLHANCNPNKTNLPKVIEFKLRNVIRDKVVH